MSELAHLSAVVHGRVQGVFFRAFVRDAAWHLDLRGYVRNLRHGTVLVEAEGVKARLLELVEQLKVGPSGAMVNHIELDWQEYSGQFSDFRIRCF